MKTWFAAMSGVAVGVTGMWGFNGEWADAAAEASPESPAYLVVLGNVYERDAFIEGYARKLGPLYERYGGEYLAVGRNLETLENGEPFQSFVISKWPSMDAARAFWSDPEYEKLKAERIQKDWAQFDVYLLEGLPEPASESPAKPYTRRR